MLRIEHDDETIEFEDVLPSITVLKDADDDGDDGVADYATLEASPDDLGLYEAALDKIREAVTEILDKKIEALQKRLKDALADIPSWMQETRARIRSLNDQTAALAIGHLLAAIASE